jgi:hypothetical protein
VISFGVFTDSLFCRPSYHHYYFGDYYAPRYVQSGFYASFTFGTTKHGYEPIWAHERWEHRNDREWAHRAETTYEYRRNNERARPPHTWAEQRSFATSRTDSRDRRDTRPVVATPLTQFARASDSPVRFRSVPQEERQQNTQVERQVQQMREQRRTSEARTAATAPTARADRTDRSDRAIEPPKVQLPKSPIASKPIEQLSKNLTPPKAPEAPRPDVNVRPQSQPSGRQERANQPPNRQQQPDRKGPPGRNDRQQQTEAQPQAPTPQQNQAEADRRARDAAAQQSQTDAQRNAANSAPDRNRNNAIAKQ